MNLGKQVRLQRIFNRETGRAIIVPMDHGVSVGPIEGIENIHKTVSDMADGGADAVLMHKGLCRCCFRASGEGKDVGPDHPSFRFHVPVQLLQQETPRMHR